MYFSCFGRRRWVSLVLLCYRRVVGEDEADLIVFSASSSRFGEYIPMGGAESRFALLREFAGKDLIRLRFSQPNRGYRGRIDGVRPIEELVVQDKAWERL